MRMNAPKGQKVAYVSQEKEAWGGADPRGILDPNETYTVEKTIVFKSMSLVTLAEHPDCEFNTVLFKEVGEQLPAVQSVEEIYLAALKARQTPSRSIWDDTPKS